MATITDMATISKMAESLFIEGSSQYLEKYVSAKTYDLAIRYVRNKYPQLSYDEAWMVAMEFVRGFVVG